MSANQTAERDLYARFTLPYRNEETVLLIRRQDKGRWQEITQLSDLLSYRTSPSACCVILITAPIFAPSCSHPRCSSDCWSG